MARVLFTRRALRDLDSLEAPDRASVLAALRNHAANPLERARKLRDPTIGTFRYRVGDLRVIFDFDSDTIVVLLLGHRKDIYR